MPSLPGLANVTAFCAQLQGTPRLSTTVYQATLVLSAAECQACGNGTATCLPGLACYQRAGSYEGLCVAAAKPLVLVPLACPFAKLTTTQLHGESCAALSAPAQQLLDTFKHHPSGPAPAPGPAFAA